MPLIFRAMYIDAGFPRCGPDARSLGVRVPPSKDVDIEPDPDGQVNPGEGGMSVAPTAAGLPVHRLPRRLRGIFPRASGSNQDAVWPMGEGAFVAGDIGNQLRLRPDPGKPSAHGFVEPAARMPCADYQTALAATRELWRRWEGDPCP
jgi:hypothetical protein